MAQDSIQDLIIVGEITSPHGIRGIVKVRSFTEDPDSLKDLTPLYSLKGDEVPLSFERDLELGSYLCSLKDIKDRTGAERYKGFKLCVYKSQLPPLQEDEFYFDDLIGCKAFDNDKELGTVSSIYDYGAGLFLEVILLDEKVATIPFNKDAVLSVDLSKKIISIQIDYLMV